MKFIVPLGMLGYAGDDGFDQLPFITDAPFEKPYWSDLTNGNIPWVIVFQSYFFDVGRTFFR